MKYDLVFEGGGAKGMVLVGAYQEFVQRGHSHNRLLGTSAGAIIAALVAAGYTPDEMLAALNERENNRSVFTTFMGQPGLFTEDEIQASVIRTLLRNIDIKFMPNSAEDLLDDALVHRLAQNLRTRHLFAFVERGGWYDATPFITWLQAKLDSGQWRGGQRQFSHMTLGQFFQATAIELSLVVSDTTAGRLLVLNHNTAADCPVVWAVRMSMSIPLVWDEVIWQQDWGTYLGRDITSHSIVDGGLLSNFPLELFISAEPQVTALMGPKQDTPVLGLLIDESLPVPALDADRGLFFDVNVKPGELRTVQRIQQLVNTAIAAHDKMVIDAFNHLVVRLPAQGYSTTEFDMSDERRAALVAAGRGTMNAYFDSQPGTADGSRGIDDPQLLHAGRSADRIAMRLLDREEPRVEASWVGISQQGGPDMPRPNVSVEPDTHKWALLIGINKYPKLPATNQLHGCVNDVNAIEGVLTSARFGFPTDHILKLVDEQATRDGILTAFRTHLIDNHNIGAGSIVVVYYSGHGSYIKDMHGDEESGFDQTIVPYDAGRKSAADVRDITDDELALLLDELGQRTQNINLIFDSCHSGTITRAFEDALEPDADGRARWVEPWTEDVPLQVDVPIGEGTRGMGPSEWLPLSEGYVLIAGCQADERSREYAFQTGLLPWPRVQHGALTYYLLQALADVDLETTYYDIWNHVRSEVTKKNGSQHPQLEGAIERKVFGGAAAPRKQYVEVVDKTRATVTLAAGLVHAATAGSRFAIYPAGTQTFEDKAARVAIIKLSEIHDFTSIGKVEEGNLDRVMVGAPAIEIEHDYGTMQLPVRIVGTGQVLDTVRQLVGESSLLSMVASDEQESKVTVKLRAPLLPDGSEDRTAGEQLHILSSGGGHSLMQPVAPDAHGPLTVRDKLEHIAKYYNILAIKNRNLQSELKGKVKLGLLKVTKDEHGQDQLEPVKLNAGGEIVLTVGDKVVLEITNQSDQLVHITVLDGNTEWRVKPVFPPAGAADDAVQAGRSRRTKSFTVNLPDYQKTVLPGQPLPLETVKVIATTDRIDFRSLWLPTLRGDERGLEAVEGAHSSLYQLMEHAVGGTTAHATRSLDEDADLVVKDWTTDDLVFQIKP